MEVLKADTSPGLDSVKFGISERRKVSVDARVAALCWNDVQLERITPSGTVDGCR